MKTIHYCDCWNNQGYFRTAELQINWMGKGHTSITKVYHLHRNLEAIKQMHGAEHEYVYVKSISEVRPVNIQETMEQIEKEFRESLMATEIKYVELQTSLNKALGLKG